MLTGNMIDLITRHHYLTLLYRSLSFLISKSDSPCFSTFFGCLSNNHSTDRLDKYT